LRYEWYVSRYFMRASDALPTSFAVASDFVASLMRFMSFEACALLVFEAAESIERRDAF
jgi:hypothetical protein